MNAPLPLQVIRPVWLFSLDSEGFHAAPTTTGALIAWYRARGIQPGSVAFRQVHFRDRAEVESSSQQILEEFAAHCAGASDPSFPPVAGLSFYTWNAAEFLELAARIRACCPQAVIVAGGPHVQQAEDWLAEDPIDVVVLGEGELTFQELLDTPRTRWSEVPGLAWRDAQGTLQRSRTRARQLRLEELPSPFDVIELCDAQGRPLYDAVSYETSRGCPFKCAFCEWGTGAIGTKMVSFPMERLRRDWERIVRAGIPNIWLADSNFGALRDDLEKAQLICELKERYGLPRTFATSWSKKHSPRVQEIVLLLNRHGLLPFYQLALQTLTPRALELCHRENMAANEYEPIARRMAAAGVPISAELIWGLPGDDLQSFEANLGRLLATFPDINIFGYTLLPGTEFYQRRAEYRIETVPVAGYGKAKGEYVVGSLSFPRAEGEEGYFLITAHGLLVSGQVLACTVRFLALQARAAVGGLLREVVDGLLEEFADAFPGLDRRARLEVYQARAAIYLRLLAEPARVYSVIRERVSGWLARHAMEDLQQPVDRLLDLDAWLCPRAGEERLIEARAAFDVTQVLDSLDAMMLPLASAFSGTPRNYRFRSPGGLGVVLLSPDGGRWLRSRLEVETAVPPLRAPEPILVLNEAGA